MARFFFHVTNGSTFKDAEGENCSSLEAARTHAAKIAGELGKDRGYEGRHMNSRRLMSDIGHPPALAPRRSVYRTLSLPQKGRQVLGTNLNCSESRWVLPTPPVLPPPKR